jgi:hypothetical protein
MADEEDICFNRVQNERLRGVSRMESLEIVLEKSARPYSDQQKQDMAARKNRYYCELIKNLTSRDILPGVLEVLNTLKQNGVKIAIGSSSKNAPLILRQVGLEGYFDVVVGRFDPTRFGQAGLRAVSPILSFKILSNMPLCFVSICENIQGPNGIFTPWEGQRRAGHRNGHSGARVRRCRLCAGRRLRRKDARTRVSQPGAAWPVCVLATTSSRSSARRRSGFSGAGNCRPGDHARRTDLRASVRV